MSFKKSGCLVIVILEEGCLPAKLFQFLGQCSVELLLIHSAVFTKYNLFGMLKVVIQMFVIILLVIFIQHKERSWIFFTDNLFMKRIHT